MANVIIKDSERKERENKILRDFGHDPETASKELKEYASYIAEKTYEIVKRRY